MKQEKITLTVGEATIKLPAATVAQLALASVLGQITPASLPPRILPDPVMVPEIGQAWPGQGGINGGFVPACGDVPAHYLIFAAKDVGDCKWGGYGTESKATSKTDGLANTDAIKAKERKHFTEEQFAEGHRLACQTFVNGDISVTWAVPA